MCVPCVRCCELRAFCLVVREAQNLHAGDEQTTDRFAEVKVCSASQRSSMRCWTTIIHQLVVVCSFLTAGWLTCSSAESHRLLRIGACPLLAPVLVAMYVRIT